MDIVNSLYISVFGMTVVFLVLVSLILLINLQSFVAAKIAGWHKTSGNAAAVPAVTASAASATLAKPLSAAMPSGPQELKLTGVDDKTAAIIMAIVSDNIGVDPSQLYFKSIRSLDEGANV